MNEKEYNKNFQVSKKDILRRCNWTKNNIKEFIKTFDENHMKDNFNECLYNIIDYGLNYEDSTELNFKDPKKYHEKGLNNFFKGKIKNEPQTFNDLMVSLEKLNEGLKLNAITKEFLEDIKISFQSIDEKTKNLAEKYKEKNDSIKYVEEWAKKIKNEKNKIEKLNEIIAHINILFNAIFEYFLRDTQIISVLVLLKRKNIKIGRIAQILTGEGKTAIVITLAAVKSLLGHKVDIVTSSEILAKRDAEDKKNKELYNALGLTIDHCIKDENGTPNHGPKACYKADIVYGDAHNFQADILNDKYMKENTRNGRDYDCIIVDEIDSMFIDDYGKSTLLAGEKPYMKRLNYILIAMWLKLTATIKDEKKETIKRNEEYLEKELVSLGFEILNNYSLKLPKYLYQYAKEEMPKWAHSAIESQFMEENVRYRVNGDKIEPVDNENTGVIQHNTNLSYGLQQFLQLKHDCTLTSVSTITSYLSNVGFFNLYKKENENNIIGLTGTLGSENAQKMLNNIYNLDFAFIPPASERMLFQLLPRLEKNDTDWMNTIINTCLREAKSEREVLIICKSIKIVENIYSEITTKYDKNRVITLKDDIDIKQNFENLPSGTIIIATNLAGRGTDISISDEILKRGGLHVCLTFLPINIRVQEQAFGRAGRKGQPGTWQLVLNLFKTISEICYISFNNEIISQIISRIKQYTSLENEFVRKAFLYENENENIILKKYEDEKVLSEKIEMKNLCFKLYDLIQKIGNITDPNSLIKKLPFNIKDLDFIREENEKKMLNQAESEIAKVIKKDKLFIKYTDFLKEDLKDLEPGTYRFSDIEEQWGFFLNKIDYEKQSEENINSQFNQFITDLKNRKQKSSYLLNSGFICQIVNNKLYNNIPDRDDASIFENIGKSIGNFFKSLFGDDGKKKKEREINSALNLSKYDCEINEDLSFASYYYRAICNIYFNSRSGAIERLNKSKELLEADIKFIEKYYAMVPSYLQNIKKSLKNKYKLYKNIIYGIIVPSRETIIDAERKILIKKKYLSEVFNKPIEEIGTEEINELKNIGFNSIFFLYEKAPWYVSLGTMLLGIGEICLGVLLSSTPISILSPILINHGITNTFKGFEMFLNGKDFKDWKDFGKFEFSNLFMLCVIPLTLEKDEKKNYNCYNISLENDSLLREKITLQREKDFDDLLKENFQELELDFEVEEKKSEKKKADIKNLKEEIKNKVIEDTLKNDNFKHLFLKFDGNYEHLRNFIMNNINSEFLKYDISKEINNDNQEKLVENISKKISTKINELLNKKKEEIEKNSLFLNEIKKELNQEFRNKIEEEQKKCNLEELKNKSQTEIDNIYKENEIKNNELNNEQKTELEKLCNLGNEKIDIEKNNISEYENNVKNYNLKINEINNLAKDHNAGKEIDQNKYENLSKEIKALEPIIKLKEIEIPIHIENIEKIKLETKKQIDEKKEEYKNKFNELNEEMKKKTEEISGVFEKQKNDLEQKMKEINDMNEKSLNLKHDDFIMDENGIKFKDEKLSNNPIFKQVLNNKNNDFTEKYTKYSDFIKNDIGGIISDQITKIEDKINFEVQEERDNKINNFGRGLGAENNGNPIYKYLDKNYEYNSKDMHILGKEILNNILGTDVEYFIDNNKKSLKEKIKNKKTIFGNYLDKEQKIWNTVCMIPDGDGYIILYKNFKGNNYDNNFNKFLKDIGLKKYQIKCNKNSQSKNVNNSSCIFSLKNLEIFSNFFKNNKDEFINNFESIKFQEFEEEEIYDLRKNKYVNLHLKTVYQKIKKDNKDSGINEPIHFLEIVSKYINNKNEAEMIDYFDKILEGLEPFITKEEEQNFKNFIREKKDEKIKFNQNLSF